MLPRPRLSIYEHPDTIVRAVKINIARIMWHSLSIHGNNHNVPETWRNNYYKIGLGYWPILLRADPRNCGLNRRQTLCRWWMRRQKTAPAGKARKAARADQRIISRRIGDMRANHIGIQLMLFGKGPGSKHTAQRLRLADCRA